MVTAIFWRHDWLVRTDEVAGEHERLLSLSLSPIKSNGGEGGESRVRGEHAISEKPLAPLFRAPKRGFAGVRMAGGLLKRGHENESGEERDERGAGGDLPEGERAFAGKFFGGQGRPFADFRREQGQVFLISSCALAHWRQRLIRGRPRLARLQGKNQVRLPEVVPLPQPHPAPSRATLACLPRARVFFYTYRTLSQDAESLSMISRMMRTGGAPWASNASWNFFSEKRAPSCCW